jgi:E3 SUMO-protein ligase PIAS1
MTLGGLVRRVANDAQKFYLSLIVCKSVPIETLVAQIQKKIRKESVVSESEFFGLQ